MTITYIHPSLTPTIFAVGKAPPASARETAQPAKSESVGGKQPDSVKTVRLDHRAVELEFQQQIEDILVFFKENTKQMDPTARETSLLNFEQLKTHLFDRNDDYFKGQYKDDKPLIFGAGKEMFKTIRTLLRDEAIPMQKRVDAIKAMAPQLAVCPGGLMTVVKEAMYTLQFSNGGIEHAAYNALIKSLDALINEYTSGIFYNQPGNHIHVVDAHFNYIAKELGLPQREDPDAHKQGISKHQLEECYKKVEAALGPESLSAILADNYLDRMRGGLADAEVDIGAPLEGKALTHAFNVSKNLAEGELQREFGMVSQESYLQPVGDDYAYQVARETTKLQHHFLHELRDKKLVDFGDSLKLGDAAQGGDVVRVGRMYWVNKEGACNRLGVDDLLNLRPDLLVGQVLEQGISPDVHSHLLHDVLREMGSQCRKNQITSLPHPWLGSFAEHLLNMAPRNERALNTALTLSVQFNDVHTIGLLGQQGVNFNGWDAQGMSVAMHAAADGHDATLRALIDNGADCNQRDNKGNTAAMYATEAGHTGALAMLRDAGADVNAISYYRSSPILLATLAGKHDALRLLIDAGAIIDTVNLDNETALHLCAKKGDAQALQLLLKAGANCNLATLDRVTPLMLASDRNDLEMMDTLIKAGANVNAKDREGDTALIRAAGRQNNEAAEKLLANGARTDIKNRIGLTAIKVSKTSEGGLLPALQGIKRFHVPHRLQRLLAFAPH
ncbi:MAG: ankyrin repeat domain-containing protein [Pseudomonadota bacterium]